MLELTADLVTTFATATTALAATATSSAGVREPAAITIGAIALLELSADLLTASALATTTTEAAAAEAATAALSFAGALAPGFATGTTGDIHGFWLAIAIVNCLIITNRVAV